MPPFYATLIVGAHHAVPHFDAVFIEPFQRPFPGAFGAERMVYRYERAVTPRFVALLLPFVQRLRHERARIGLVYAPKIGVPGRIGELHAVYHGQPFTHGQIAYHGTVMVGHYKEFQSLFNGFVRYLFVGETAVRIVGVAMSVARIETAFLADEFQFEFDGHFVGYHSARAEYDVPRSLRLTRFVSGRGVVFRYLHLFHGVSASADVAVGVYEHEVDLVLPFSVGYLDGIVIIAHDNAVRILRYFYPIMIIQTIVAFFDHQFVLIEFSHCILLAARYIKIISL